MTADSTSRGQSAGPTRFPHTSKVGITYPDTPPLACEDNTLKADIEQSLILTIAEKLGELTVKNDMFIDTAGLKWIDDLSSRLDAGFRDKLIRNCGSRGIKDFLVAEIQRRLQSKYSYNKVSDKKPIADYPEFKNLLSVSRQIVERMKRLPFPYRVTLGLPLTFSEPILPYIESTAFKTHKASIVAPAGLPNPFPLETGNPRLDYGLFSDWLDQDAIEDSINEKRLYFSILVDGYAGGEGSQILARQLEDDLRAFYGAAQALSMLENHYSIQEGSKKPQVMVHHEDKHRTIVYTGSMEEELWSAHYQLSTFWWMEGLPENRRAGEIAEKMGLIAQIYSDDLALRRIYTACIWFYRANVSKRPLDALLESTIAMEVMLGDEKESEGVGLTKLLRNRCAYMLGQDQSEREAILQSFTDLYKLRSAIVHSGRHRASESERAVVSQALGLCGRVIAHELRGAASATPF